MMSLAQDPDELFNVVTADGKPTGVQKRRADVHRDGDWHAAIHIWVARIVDGENQVVFQRRSLAKDTFGGMLDATVGGHLNSGESWREALRESREEIGVAWPEQDLIPLGQRVAVSEDATGKRDREIQHIFIVHDDRPLNAYIPDPIELAGLVAIPVDGLLDLIAGIVTSVPAERFAVGATESATEIIDLCDFPPVLDRYYYRVGLAARSFLNGERHFTV